MPSHRNRRQLICWRTLAQALGGDASAPSSAAMETPMRELTADIDLPPLLLDPRPSIDDVVRRYPELEEEMPRLIPTEETLIDAESVRRNLIYAKTVLNVFRASSGTVSASQYNQWLQDVDRYKQICAGQPSDLMGEAEGERGEFAPHPAEGYGQEVSGGTGGAPEVRTDDVDYALAEIAQGRGLASSPEIRASLAGMEKDLVDRMALAEVLKDRKLAEKLTPSAALIEQLLRQKGRLGGEALANAKGLIRRYVDQLGDILKRDVEMTAAGKPDATVPPKRVFRNLDLKRTVWKNLTNYDPEERRLYVDRLFYHRTAKSTNKTRLILVVDQSGSMVDAMVNCTILASIFAGLPRVDAHMIAFDTEVIDLTAWVNDPFEALLRTKLGGGNDGPKAMLVAQAKIVDPRNTVMVWVSDFYEFGNDKPLFAMIRTVKQSGVTFLPVGSVSSSGYFNVNPWFRKKLKVLGTPLISGSLKTLIRELKTALPS